MFIARSLSIVALVAVSSVPVFAAVIPTGDVAVAVGNSTVKVFNPNGTLFETLNDGSGTLYTTGMAFDAANELFVTNFGSNTVSKFNANGTLASTNFLTNTSTAESIVVNAAGNFLVGGPNVAKINAFSSAGGAPTTSYTVTGGNGTGGTDWIDLAANQSTVLYDGEGTVILSYDLNTHAASTFASGLTGSVFALRIIPAGTFAGDVLAADSTHAVLLNSAGAVIKTYLLPGNDGSDFALNLDPNGTSFWTADSSGEVWEVDIATGAIQQMWNSGSTSTFGLAVDGEITAGGPPPPPTGATPEPGTLALLGTGLTSLTLLKNKFRRRSS